MMLVVERWGGIDLTSFSGERWVESPISPPVCCTSEHRMLAYLIRGLVSGLPIEPLTFKLLSFDLSGEVECVGIKKDVGIPLYLVISGPYFGIIGIGLDDGGTREMLRCFWDRDVVSLGENAEKVLAMRQFLATPSKSFFAEDDYRKLRELVGKVENARLGGVLSGLVSVNMRRSPDGWGISALKILLGSTVASSFDVG